MMKRTLQLLTLSLLTAGLVLAAFAEEKGKEASKDAPPPLSKEEQLEKANFDLAATAFKLKQHGWGENTKKGWTNVSIESLITAARIIKELPPPKKIEGVEVEASKNPDAPEGPVAKLTEGQMFDRVGLANEILARARELVKETVTDPKKATAYETLIKDVETIEATKAVSGGPKFIQRVLPAGQTHSYHWTWDKHISGTVAFSSNLPMILRIVQDGGYTFCNGGTMGGQVNFLPGGPGVPKAGQKIGISVHVRNPGKGNGVYSLGAQ